MAQTLHSRHEGQAMPLLMGWPPAVVEGRAVLYKEKHQEMKAVS